MTRRNTARDQVAIVGVGTTPYLRNAGRSELSLVVEACKNAVADAGLSKSDIDGLSGDLMRAEIVQGALGLDSCSWTNNCLTAFNMQIMNAVMAVHAGYCDTVIAYHSMYRTAATSGSAGADPFRARAMDFANVRRPTNPWPDGITGEVNAYAPWVRRYFHDYGGSREHLGYLAINCRTHAGANDHAALRDPITMEDYLNARIVWEPLGLLDCEYTIDGADAFVITTAERAKDLPHPPVLVHAAVAGQMDRPSEESLLDLSHTAQNVVAEHLWPRSELTIDDIDLFLPFDGFTIGAFKWFEEIGFCPRGETGPYLEESWDAERALLALGGRVPVNTHGGNLSEGASQGSGHVREAVRQLRGTEGARQVEGARTALFCSGGFWFNPGAIIFRT